MERNMKPNPDIVKILSVREGIRYNTEGKPETVFNVNYETDEHYIGRVIIPAKGLTKSLIMDKIKQNMMGRRVIL